jgi:hypothetical protein
MNQWFILLMNHWFINQDEPLVHLAGGRAKSDGVLRADTLIGITVTVILRSKDFKTLQEATKAGPAAVWYQRSKCDDKSRISPLEEGFVAFQLSRCSRIS